MGTSKSLGAGPLAGLRVIDLSVVLAGPLCCQILGDFGADVVKVENPRGGDSMRNHGPAKNGEPLWWKMLGRNKRSVGIALGDPAGAEVFKDIAATADVVVESFRPGTLERYGLGWDVLSAVNPRLILARITGFGQKGPYARRPAFGTLIEAMSGFAHITGQSDGPPTLPPFGLADSIAGISAASAVSMALYHRDARGAGGQVIDVSILEPMIAVLGPQPIVYDQLGVVQERFGNQTRNNAPRNAYQTLDRKWVAISTSSTSIAERVMRLVGHPEVVDKPWFAKGSGRAENGDLLDGYVASWIAARTQDEVLAEFERVEAAAAPVYDIAELLDDPQVQYRDMITTADDEALGPLRMQNVLFRMSETPGSIRFTGRELGADTHAILTDELGFTAGHVAELRARGIIA